MNGDHRAPGKREYNAAQREHPTRGVGDDDEQAV